MNCDDSASKIKGQFSKKLSKIIYPKFFKTLLQKAKLTLIKLLCYPNYM